MTVTAISWLSATPIIDVEIQLAMRAKVASGTF